MPSRDIGQLYDPIAAWWRDQHVASDYGVAQVRRALTYVPNGGAALDVGCGAGGRFVRLLQRSGFTVRGLDASQQMIALAENAHTDAQFERADIRHWETDQRFDFVLAWDSLFHLPLDQHVPVLEKLCRLLNNGGVMIHTFGNAHGSHTDTWRGQTFPYSSIGIDGNIRALQTGGLSLMHLELDQYPAPHVFAISQKS